MSKILVFFAIFEYPTNLKELFVKSCWWRM